MESVGFGEGTLDEAGGLGSAGLTDGVLLTPEEIECLLGGDGGDEAAPPQMKGSKE